MKNPATVWNGHDWETLELEVALAREADGTGQISDNIGAHELLTPEEFMKKRSMIAAKQPAKSKDDTDEVSEVSADREGSKPDPKGPAQRRGEYQTTDMKAKKP